MNYYRTSNKRVGHVAKRLQIAQQSVLKDCIFDRSILKAQILSFHNSKIRQSSLLLLQGVRQPLPAKQLDLSQNFSFISDSAVQILCRVSFTSLQCLKLADNDLSDLSLKLIGQSPLNALKQLVLYGNTGITSQGLVYLSNAAIALQTLDVHATSICDAGMTQYLLSACAHALKHLNVSMNWTRVSDETLDALAHSHHCKALQIINVEDCSITDAGVQCLVDSANTVEIREIYLNNSINQKNNQVADGTIKAIAFSKHIHQLKILEVRNSKVSADGIKMLAVSSAMEKLEILRLSHCQFLDNQALYYLQTIAQEQVLKKLYINSTKITREEIEIFQKKYPNLNVIY